MGIDYPANKMDFSAKHTGKPDISHSFPWREAADGNFFVRNLCSQTLKNRMEGKIINVRNWMLECYGDFAGDIHFLTPRAKKKGTREKNAIHLYAPGCRFKEDTRNACLPLRETFMHFNNGEIFRLDSLTGKKSKFCRFFDPEEKVMKLMVEAAEATALKGEAAFWQVQSIFMRCLDYLLNSTVKISEDTYEIRERETSPEEELVIKAEDFMRKNISEKIKNPDIAEFLNMSESSFAHRFKKAAGVSPNVRLLEMRIDAAKNLLLKGARLKNIAESAGFKDEFYLSRIFKKITGVAPRDFRAGGG